MGPATGLRAGYIKGIWLRLFRGPGVFVCVPDCWAAARETSRERHGSGAVRHGN